LRAGRLRRAAAPDLRVRGAVRAGDRHAIRHQGRLAAYARQICGSGSYDVLDQLFVGNAGPGYVRIRFACS
jgi:hypothetical protein